MTDGDDLSVAMSSATVNDSEMWWRMLRWNEKWNSVPPSDWIERKSLFTPTNSSSGYCFNSQSTRNFLFFHSHNDLPWNIRKFLKNQLREFRFGENLKEIAPWSTSSWSHTDLRRLKEGMVAAQVICEQIIPSFEKKWRQNWNVTFVVAVAYGFMRAITGSRGKKMECNLFSGGRKTATQQPIQYWYKCLSFPENHSLQCCYSLSSSLPSPPLPWTVLVGVCTVLIAALGRCSVDCGTNRLDTADRTTVSATHEFCDQCRGFVWMSMELWFKFVEYLPTGCRINLNSGN